MRNKKTALITLSLALVSFGKTCIPDTWSFNCIREALNGIRNSMWPRMVDRPTPRKDCVAVYYPDSMSKRDFEQMCKTTGYDFKYIFYQDYPATTNSKDLINSFVGEMGTIFPGLTVRITEIMPSVFEFVPLYEFYLLSGQKILLPIRGKHVPYAHTINAIATELCVHDASIRLIPTDNKFVLYCTIDSAIQEILEKDLRLRPMRDNCYSLDLAPDMNLLIVTTSLPQCHKVSDLCQLFRHIDRATVSFCNRRGDIVEPALHFFCGRTIGGIGIFTLGDKGLFVYRFYKALQFYIDSLISIFPFLYILPGTSQLRHHAMGLSTLHI